MTSGDSIGTQAELIGDRYRAHEELGRGGMACVYRVEDLSTGRTLALKQLITERGAAERSTAAALFEREFHTLVQLRHPHVIAVYDYGLLDGGAPFYTMELLDGGDLRDRAPLPWREVCRLFFDVCSSLALLHSRRLLHRDISPRNIRCTRDGHAKLIDFGAMAAMNTGGADVVGTPAFVAPETVHRLALDARTDLFSLGATLYFALTGHLAYAARTFADATAAWRGKVVPPSAWAPDIPVGLDDLVLALIHPEPELRPQNAFEVMQRLAALAGLESRESEAVSRAYLSTPMLVGRESALADFRERLVAARIDRSAGVVIEGGPGIGRSRLLDAYALEAKTLGFTVLRATASQANEQFAIALGLTKHLFEVLPSANVAPPNPERLQESICELWSGVSQQHPLLIAVDDVHRIDAGSAAVLAALLDGSRRAGVFVALAADSDAEASDGLRALERRCARVTVHALSVDQTRHLLSSLFGEVSNLELLAGEIQPIALGNPRQIIDLAQHLIDRGLIRYAAGSWTLPAVLTADDLPRSGTAALRARVAALPRTTRFLLEAHALAFFDSLDDRQYRALLPDAGAQDVEQALVELVAKQALIAEGSTYRLPNRLWVTALCEGLDANATAARHRALADMYAKTSRIASIHHYFAGGLDQQGIVALQGLNAQLTEKLDHTELLANKIGKMMPCYPQALASLERLGGTPRELNELRYWHFAGLTTVEDATYPDSARLLLAQLERDSGLDLYRADPDVSDPMQRLMRALQGAQQRSQATPEAERVFSVEEALRKLAEYVVFGIVISSRSQDCVLLESLAPLLEPFAVLSPILDAIWKNARATSASQSGDLPLARELWLDVLGKLEKAEGPDAKYATEIRNAIAFGVGRLDAQLGLPSAVSWADQLDRDPVHRVSALQLRRIVRLQSGDSRGAERLRGQAEVLALQMRGAQMFNVLLGNELLACGMACDLPGIQDVVERIRPLAARYPGWGPALLFGEAYFHLARGDYEAAKMRAEDCISLTEFDPAGVSRNPIAWFGGCNVLTEALLGLDRPADAQRVAHRVLERCNERGSRYEPIEIVRLLALADAKLGDATAVERLEAAIEAQRRLGVSGLPLGLSFEARAQIAIWQRDAVAFEHYAELTAREYRYGAGSGLGARYDRLLNEAGRSGLRAQAALADFAVSSTTERGTSSNDLRSAVLQNMAGRRHTNERAHAALQLICSAHNAPSGHLYLAAPAGVVRCASFGDGPAPIDLGELNAFIARAHDRAAAMDDMTTGDLAEETEARSSVIVGDTQYELLPLTCVLGDRYEIAGVVAVACDGGALEPARSVQLLQILAQYFMQIGDSTGFSAS